MNLPFLNRSYPREVSVTEQQAAAVQRALDLLGLARSSTNAAVALLEIGRTSDAARILRELREVLR